MSIIAAVSSSSCLRIFPSCLHSRFVAFGAVSRGPKALSVAITWNGRRCRVLGSSPRDILNESVEDSKFVPLNEDDPIYGPPVLLLAGFEISEADKIKQFLSDMEGDFLQIIFCTKDMLSLTVWDAVHTQPQNLQSLRVATSLRRVCIFSGLSGEEIMMFIEAFPKSGLAPAIFAAMVPNSADKLLGQVLEEIIGDHEALQS
ncbi:vacuolar acid trehalase isoform X2 [Wolffia australiana]